MFPAVLLVASIKSAPAPAKPGKVIVIGESGARWTGEPISLDLKDADLVDVLMSFSKIAKENVVVDPGVRGSVTVRLRDVPWDQALDLIVRMNGYAVAREPRILRIGRPAALAR
ncbi:MAG TPA: secretin and TonB N-terminal domain-containing protein [Thermoanaerobaculia bacterium]|nr:secretin and TonB N-terminal domain-containing protein [Thermoanaerobaculia bacterium]